MTLPTEVLRARLATLQGLKDRRTYRAMEFFTPYPKQQEFFDLGISKTERLLIAANGVGKTHSGGFETACHLTGLYPEWWLGRTWNRPTLGWAAGESGLVVRDTQQRKLCGPPGVDALFGTGLIPKDLFVDKPSLSRGVTDAFDTIQVKNVAKGRPLDDSAISVLRFKSYEQGRKKFQAENLDFGWCDEEPDEEVYNEFLARMRPTKENPDGGIMFVTFTPLLGRSKVVLRYIESPSPDRAYINMTMDDALHLAGEAGKKLLARYDEHERDARSKGVPLLGSGAIYTTPEEQIKESALTHIPSYWAKIWGVDFGKFAAVLMLWDRDNDVLHIHAAFRIHDPNSLFHAHAMQRIGADVPVAWPHDGHQGDKGSGTQVSKLYKDHGLRMLPEHATHATGGYAVWAGIREIQERERSGRFKVASHLGEFFDERRFYHRKDGEIVKENDHIMDAVRAAVMMKRHAQAVGLGGKSIRKKGSNLVAADVEFDLF